jgi:hypothetical protein
MKLLIISLLISTSAWAKFPLINFEGLSGDYVDKKGIAYAQSGKYEIPPVVKLSHNEIEVRFNKIQKNLVIKDANTTVELGFDFSFLNVFRAINFAGVDISSDQKKFRVFMESLNIYVDPNEYRIRDLDVVTDVSQIADVGDDIDILDGFMINGDLNITEASFGKITQNEMMNNLISENPEKEEEIRKIFSFVKIKKGIPLVARDLRMVVRKETFSGSVKLDSWINLNLYLGGKMEHKAKEKQLVINLLRAKLGYFSIRKWILRAIRNLNSENITIDGTKIIIDLEKTILSSRN